MTPEAPLGEYIDPNDKAERPPPPAPDELLEASWVRSSWDLLNGLEVTESGPGDLIDSYFDVPPPAPTQVPLRERPKNAGEWIRRCAIRLAELDWQRDPKEVIEVAKRQWMTTHYLLPEEAAELEHVGASRR
jgi:hypothetical protein